MGIHGDQSEGALSAHIGMRGGVTEIHWSIPGGLFGGTCGGG